jgi:hypothetical protein
MCVCVIGMHLHLFPTPSPPQHIGYILEENSILKTLARQFLRTHRPFEAHIMDAAGNIVLRV